MVLSMPVIRPAAWPLLQRLRAHPPTLRRVAAWSGALAVHGAVLLVLLLPRLPQELPAPSPKPIDTVWIPVEPVLVPVLPAPAAPVRPTLQQPQAQAPLAPPVQLAPLSPMSVPAPQFTPPVEAAPTGPAVPVAAPGPSHAIAIASVTPPPYPGPALRRGLEGTVQLLVLVGSDGVPAQVTIERSSGHRELDRAAREHVLAEWRFHPALRNGRAVAATARVPIVFRIR